MAPIEEEGPVQPAYERIAADIRDAIDRGDYEPGAALPSAKDLAKKHGVRSQETALKALRHLRDEGYVDLRHRAGAYVRRRPAQRLVVRDRHVYRDQLGYFFDKGAQDWRAVGTPSRELRVPPRLVAQLLGVSEGQTVLARDRAMGPDPQGPPLQLSTSYIPLGLVAEISVLGSERTGPGGIYDRIEEHFEQAISWRETISAELPDAQEQERLHVPPTVALLVITRETHITRGGKDLIAEVNQTRMSSEAFSVAYEVQRDASAAWPREERV